MNRDKLRIAAKEIQLEKSRTLGHVIFHGRSMRPFFEDGDELISERVEWDSIKAGDIITYREEDKFPTRRVIRKYGRKLILKADNWPELFEADKEDVLARITERKRAGAVLSSRDRQWMIQAYKNVWGYRKGRIEAKLRYYQRTLRGLFK